jgi:site-specific DNA-methyltransferase (adenine-specific)
MKRKKLQQRSELWCGDCLDLMPDKIEDQIVDLILCDLPYGTTGLGWDKVLDLSSLWEQYNRVLKPRCPVVLTASQPFTTDLINSNRPWFKYCWVWSKTVVGDIFNAKNKPLKLHEDVVVFSEGTTANCSSNRMPYFPQGIRIINRTQKRDSDVRRAFIGPRPSHKDFRKQTQTNYPTSILRFANDSDTAHNTQKPLALMEYLVRTYSKEGETVLDNTMGGGSTGLAAVRTGRKFIGIEKDPEIFKVAETRIRTLEATGIVVGKTEKAVGFWRGL